jgi:hypothetical protein
MAAAVSSAWAWASATSVDKPWRERSVVSFTLSLAETRFSRVMRNRSCVPRSCR